MSAYPFPIYRHIYTGEASSIKSTHTHTHTNTPNTNTPTIFLPLPPLTFFQPAFQMHCLWPSCPLSLFLPAFLPSHSPYLLNLPSAVTVHINYTGFSLPFPLLSALAFHALPSTGSPLQSSMPSLSFFKTFLQANLPSISFLPHPPALCAFPLSLPQFLLLFPTFLPLLSFVAFLPYIPTLSSLSDFLPFIFFLSNSCLFFLFPCRLPAFLVLLLPSLLLSLQYCLLH